MRRTSALAWASTNKRAVGRTPRHRILFWQVLLLLAKNEIMENSACALENQVGEVTLGPGQKVYQSDCKDSPSGEQRWPPLHL